MVSGIYIIRCLVNGKVYVGQSVNFKGRKNSHLCDLRTNRGIQKLQDDWNTYGEESFEFVLLEQIDDKNKRNEREKFYIQKFSSITDGYNTNTGGIGQGNFGYLNGMYGKQHTEKSKKQMSEHRKGLTSGERNPMYGKHHTEATKQKISEANRGRVLSEDRKRQISETSKRLWQDPEHRQSLLMASKVSGLKNRKYTDEFIKTLRLEHDGGLSITKLAKKYNIPRSSCENIILGYGRFKYE